MFKFSKVGTIAGSMVVSGVVKRDAKVRVIRDGVIINDSTINTIAREKDQVKEVKQGIECGITVTDFNDIKVTSFSSFDTKEHKTINKVSEKVWKKYEELTTVDSVIPIDLYSAYTKNKYLTVRYKNNSENIISNEMIIKAYRDSLLKEESIFISKKCISPLSNLNLGKCSFNIIRFHLISS